jgi:hypothetical protein
VNVTTTDPTEAPSRRHAPWAIALVWMLPIGLVVLALAVAGLVQVHRARSTGSSWPARISVNGRNYDRSGTVSKADFTASAGNLRQVGTAGPNGDPVFADVIPGAAPTGVIVQTSGDSYVEYSLSGGP